VYVRDYNYVNSNSMSFTVNVAPNITSLSPTSGNVGQLVSINGSNFGTWTGGAAVFFGGYTATIYNWSSTYIQVYVPSGPVGTVSVYVRDYNYVNSNSMSFTVITTPNITSVTPYYVYTGTIVSISGSNFGISQGTGYVRLYLPTYAYSFNVYSILYWSDTYIQFYFPSLPYAYQYIDITVIRNDGVSSNTIYSGNYYYY
jgi:hypothetical protein